MNDDLVNKLIKLASGGVNVNVDLQLGAQGLPADPEPPAPTDDPVDQYINYRKLAIPVGRVSVYAVNEAGTAGETIGYLRNHDVVEVEKWNYHEGDGWRRVRIVDLGDASERSGELEGVARGWIKKSSDWEFVAI